MPDRPEGDHIKLDQFMKWQGLVDSGGAAKPPILDGRVKVNGEVETRRGRKLHTGDRIEFDGQTLVVDLATPP